MRIWEVWSCSADLIHCGLAAVASARIMCDILNEPDFGNLRWEAYNGLPALSDLYLQAMDALYAANPGLLFFIEGEQSPAATTYRLMPRMSAPIASPCRPKTIRSMHAGFHAHACPGSTPACLARSVESCEHLPVVVQPQAWCSC